MPKPSLDCLLHLNSENKLMAINLLLKIFKCLSLYGIYDFCKTGTNYLLLFFVIFFISSIFTFIIQALIDQNDIRAKLPYVKIVFIGCVSILKCYFLVNGLLLTGPVRGIIIYETSDFVIIAILSTINNIHSQPPSKIRGTACFIFSIILYLFFDHDDPHSIVMEHNNMYQKILNLSDHKKGVFYLIICLILRITYDKLVKKLSIQIGGMKITQLIMYVNQTLLCLILYFIQQNVPIFDSQSSDGYQTHDFHFWLSWILYITFIAFTIYVANFYIDITCSVKIEKNALARVSTITCYVATYLIYRFRQSYYSHDGIDELAPAQNLNHLPSISDHFNFAKLTTSQYLNFPSPTNHDSLSPHFLSVGAYVAIIFMIIAVINLTSTSQKSCKGHFVGYSTFTGLPLYVYSAGQLSTMSQSFKSTLFSFFRQISQDRSSRPIFYFLIANLLFMLVEIIYGAWTNSLGLISDGFHMLFDCSALVMGLFAAIMSKWKPNKIFTYGYGRAEILSGFLNGLFLLLVSINVFTAAIDRLFEPPTIESEQLLLVSFVGLLINLIGIYAFHFAGGDSHNHSHGGGCSHHHHTHHDHPHITSEHKSTHQTHLNHIQDDSKAATTSLPNGAHQPEESSSTSNGNHQSELKREMDHVVTFDKGNGPSNHDISNKPNRHTHHHTHQGHSHSQHSSHSHANMNMRGLFLHVLADALGSVGVIVSSFFVERYGWYRADPICSLFTSLLIFFSVLPLLKESFVVLALRTPDELNQLISQITAEISHLPYVKYCLSPHFWKISSNYYVCTFHVLVESNAPQFYEIALQSQISSKLIAQIREELGETTKCTSTIQVDRESFYNHLTGMSKRSEIPFPYPTSTGHLSSDTSHITAGLIGADRNITATHLTSAVCIPETINPITQQNNNYWHQRHDSHHHD